MKLEVAKIKRARVYKYGIVAGNSILAKFKTLERAQEDLKDNASFYEYWAGSVSVSVDNSAKFTVIL